MSCNSCLTKFNFFHKEMGCANCGVSYCSKCLKQKCRVPNKGSAELNVCKICYSKLAAGTSNTSNNTIIPPDAYLKRLENLENPSAPPITMYHHSTKLQKLRTGLEPADVQILERLEKLREDRKVVVPPSESELRNRLATLKGENPYVEEPKKTFAPDTRTDQEKADALLAQFTSEREIELAHNPQEGIEARIASLREKGIRPNENSYLDKLHDTSSSEEEVDKITKKIMDEVALDERCPMTLRSMDGSDDSEFTKSDSPELPWCVICNNDATLRCLDCDGDLYCQTCHDEVHEDVIGRHSGRQQKIKLFKTKSNF